MAGDPFRACAVKALRGEYGVLQAWQREGYMRGLELGMTASRNLVITQYDGEHKDGIIDRRERPCSLRHAASNRIAENAWVWVMIPRDSRGRGGTATLRQVLDCGAGSNDPKAAAIGGTWVDLWFPTVRAARAAGVYGWDLTRGAVIACR